MLPAREPPGPVMYVMRSLERPIIPRRMPVQKKKVRETLPVRCRTNQE